jgi:hypothetical protein
MNARWRVALGVLALVALWLLGLHVGGLDTGILFLAPAFLLLLPLLGGRYPGERLLTAFIPRARRAPRALASPRRAPATRSPRGGLLVACALAKRGPPVAAPAVRVPTAGSRPSPFF